MGRQALAELDGLPVVAHTWRHLDQAASVDQVVLVVRNESCRV